MEPSGYFLIAIFAKYFPFFNFFSKFQKKFGLIFLSYHPIRTNLATFLFGQSPSLILRRDASPVTKCFTSLKTFLFVRDFFDLKMSQVKTREKDKFKAQKCLDWSNRGWGTPYLKFISIFALIKGENVCISV